MTKAQIEKEILRQMNCLKISREEATQLVYDDLEIDRMSIKECQSDLTEEQRKNAKKATITGEKTKKKPTAYKFERKTRPKDTEKVEIVQRVFEFLENWTEKCEIANEGQKISFEMGENSYSFTLTKHRKPKKVAE